MGTGQPRASKSDISAQSEAAVSFGELVAAIQAEWNKAEEAIKRSEQIALDVAIPAISELRYAGRRLIDALDLINRKGDAAKIQALLEDSRFCCHRAQHDAIDAAMAKIGIDLDVLTSKLGFEAVIDAYPEFREFFAEFTVARGKIVSSRANREDRNGIYDAITAVDLPNLTARYERIMAVRPLAKRSALKRWFGSIGGAVTLFLLVVTAVFAGLAVDWSKWLPRHPEKAPTSQRDALKN